MLPPATLSYQVSLPPGSPLDPQPGVATAPMPGSLTGFAFEKDLCGKRPTSNDSKPSSVEWKQEAPSNLSCHCMLLCSVALSVALSVAFLCQQITGIKDRKTIKLHEERATISTQR